MIPEDLRGSASTLAKSGKRIQLKPVEQEESMAEDSGGGGTIPEEHSEREAGILLSEKDSEPGIIELPSPISELRRQSS